MGMDFIQGRAFASRDIAVQAMLVEEPRKDPSAAGRRYPPGPDKRGAMPAMTSAIAPRLRDKYDAYQQRHQNDNERSVQQIHGLPVHEPDFPRDQGNHRCLPGEYASGAARGSDAQQLLSREGSTR